MTKFTPSPFNALDARQKKFVRLILEGVSPEEATLQLYPCCRKQPGTLGFRNLDLRVATIMGLDKIKAAIRFMTGHQGNPDVIKNNLMHILANHKLKPSERLKAMAMLERMEKRSVAAKEPSQRKQTQQPGHDDHQLRAKLKDLETKVLQ